MHTPTKGAIMKYFVILLACLCLLACSDSEAAGIWTYCGTNALSTTLTLTKEAGTGHVLALASGVANPPTSVDLLISADPSAPQRWHQVDRQDVPAGGGNVNLECDTDCAKNVQCIYFIVDASTTYTKSRRPCP